MANSNIQGRAVKKLYVQPDGNRIELIAPTELDVFPIKIVASLGLAPDSNRQIAVVKP